MWVATGAHSNALTSIQFSGDGTNWSNITTGGFTSLGYRVAWNGSMWLAGGRMGGPSIGSIQYSYDGRNWYNNSNFLATNIDYL